MTAPTQPWKIAMLWPHNWATALSWPYHEQAVWFWTNYATSLPQVSYHKLDKTGTLQHRSVVTIKWDTSGPMLGTWIVFNKPWILSLHPSSSQFLFTVPWWNGPNMLPWWHLWWLFPTPHFRPRPLSPTLGPEHWWPTECLPSLSPW